MNEPNDTTPWYRTHGAYGALTAVIAAATAGVTALLLNISERKAEQRTPFVRMVEVGENDTEPAKWGQNWPAQYDGYKKTALKTVTKFGGHAGSEALPEEKIARDPWLKRMFPRLRLLHRLPRSPQPRLHARGSRGDAAPDQAAVRLVPALSRLDHAPVP